MEHAEAIVSLLDSCWFEQEIFAKRAPTSSSGSIVLDRDQEVTERSSESRIEEITRVSSALSRSMSDQLSLRASLLSDSPSPNSVLRPLAHLHPVESGKEISEEALSGFQKQGTGVSVNSRQSKRWDDRRRMKNKKALSKSLSDLEFEELKGFMDLGGQGRGLKVSKGALVLMMRVLQEQLYV
ncbi:uncharacterized protein LOC116204322 [Punica granatum]|uniref:Uncharacterized protein LOC116204322 n=1 Tax=Punica granatum TaxID=22663 RepID=A0A6P8D6R4_PUNGR|nr:uncharacterized protein LOC116204322 [Punica granatum]